tara:strand:+ start:13931 stop:14776 length:846 start_codon:yes stop_codon:yes gene_type:complete
MKYKIVERPRFEGYGNGNAIRQRRAAVRDMDQEQLEALPTKEGMRRPHVMNWSGKELNENLNPLYRFLNKQAGRPWNDVYSEICENIRPDSATQLHILQHVFDIVETKVKLVDGKPCYLSRTYWRTREENLPITDWGNGSYSQMYVDPEDGILKIAPRREKIKRRRNFRDGDKFYTDDPLVQYHRIKGIWYRIDFRELEDKDIVNRNKEGKLLDERFWRVGAHDILSGRKPFAFPHYAYDWLPRLYEWEHHYGGRIVPINKRQLNSKEIKQYGLHDRKEAA